MMAQAQVRLRCEKLQHFSRKQAVTPYPCKAGKLYNSWM
jgi:hypothetical protein